MRSAVLPWVVVGLLGCSSDEKIPLLPLPESPLDASKPVRDFTVVPDPDGGADAEADAGGGGDGGPDTDAVAPDGGTDAAPVELPTTWYTAALALGGRTGGYVVYRDDQRFHAVPYDHTGVAGEPFDLGPASESRPLGARDTSGAPWVVLTEPGTGALVAYNLAEGASVAARPTGLTGPGLLVPYTRSTSVDAILVGRDEEGRMALVDLKQEGGVSEVVVDPVGAGLPVAVAPGVEGWTFAYDSGFCATLSALHGYEWLHWACGARAGDRLVGGGDELVLVGERVGGFQAMVAAAPGHVPAEAPGYTTLVSGAVLGELAPLNDGHLVLLVQEAEGAAVWEVGAESTGRLPVEAADPVIGLMKLGNQKWLATWDDEAGAPAIAQVELEAGPAPPGWTNEACATREPVSCSVDGGCAESGPCCAEHLDETFFIQEPGFSPSGAWFVGTSQQGLVIALHDGATARVYSTPVGEPFQLAQWEAAGKLRAFANDETWVAMLVVETGAGGAETARILSRAEGGEPVVTDSPCGAAPTLDVDIRGQVTRVYCSSEAYDGGMAVPYPVGDVRWMTRVAGGNEERMLVAVGDSYDLAVWTDAETIEFTDDVALPAEVQGLSAEDKELPFVLPVSEGGRASRVRAGVLEVLVGGVGWVPVPATSWPDRAAISRYEPVAWSLAFERDPMGLSATLSLFAHDLRAGGSPFGRFVGEPGVSSDAITDLAVAPFDAGDTNRPQVFFGRAAAGVTLHQFRVDCR